MVITALNSPDVSERLPRSWTPGSTCSPCVGSRC